MARSLSLLARRGTPSVELRAADRARPGAADCELRGMAPSRVPFVFVLVRAAAAVNGTLGLARRRRIGPRSRPGAPRGVRRAACATVSRSNSNRAVLALYFIYTSVPIVSTHIRDSTQISTECGPGRRHTDTRHAGSGVGDRLGSRSLSDLASASAAYPHATHKPHTTLCHAERVGSATSSLALTVSVVA